MPQRIKLAVAQPSTLPTLSATLSALERHAQDASSRGADILLLPEAYLGGYPRGTSFGATIGSRSAEGREQFLRYWNNAIDLGDTPLGDAEWTNWSTLHARNGDKKQQRGDGTREILETITRDTGIFIVIGLVEKSGGSLYCSSLYICPQEGCIGKRRKIQPTGTERLVWTQGSPATLRAVVTTIKGVRITLAAAICWENYMPLLRYALYSQNVNLWLAPTADARDTWLGLMRTVASEGRCFVVSSCMCGREGEGFGVDGKVDEDVVNGTGERAVKRRTSTVTRTEDNHEITWPASTSPSRTSARRRSSVAIAEGPHELRLPVVDSPSGKSPSLSHAAIESQDGQQVETEAGSGPPPKSEGWSCRGGSCIIGPDGAVLAGPLWEDEGGILVAEVDFEDCIRGRLDFDAAGSYSRNDAFDFKVKGLDLSPP